VLKSIYTLQIGIHQEMHSIDIFYQWLEGGGGGDPFLLYKSV